MFRVGLRPPYSELIQNKNIKFFKKGFNYIYIYIYNGRGFSTFFLEKQILLFIKALAF